MIKIQAFCFAGAGILFSLLVMFTTKGLAVASILACLIFAGLLVWQVASVSKSQALIAEAARVSKSVSQGFLEDRITNITDKGNIGELCWSINNMLDQLEAFMREVDTAVEYANHSKFFRPALSKGLKGFSVPIWIISIPL